MRTYKKSEIDEHIVVFGFGAQGTAQAKNLSDSGVRVSVYLRPRSPHIADVKKAGIRLITDPKAAAREASQAALLIPDREQPSFYKNTLDNNLPKNAALVFAHGFSIHYRQIVPRRDLDVILVAPLAQGVMVRENFADGGNVPCLVAVERDATGRARRRARAYAEAIGRMGPFIDTTFAEEVESDLFAEQVVLCGGVPELVRAAFDTLVEGGLNPDVAYFSCLKELKWLVDFIDRYGIAGMREKISETALYGAMTRGPVVIDYKTRKRLLGILREIRSGRFAREIASCPEKVKAVIGKGMKKDKRHLIEKVHKKYGRL